jgi:hypothetical protein
VNQLLDGHRAAAVAVAGASLLRQGSRRAQRCEQSEREGRESAVQREHSECLRHGALSTVTIMGTDGAS